MPPQAPIVLGRYALYDEIAAGGMATVHLARLLGEAGFSRTVAIKRLHPQFAKAPEFVDMFLDEAHLVARIRHPNVVPTLDVVATDGELFLVMDLVQGGSLSKLWAATERRREHVPLRVTAAVVANVLDGLHAAHEARDERGEPLGIVHRDVSPQNVLVGADGVARVLDFGIAKSRGRLHSTRNGKLRGKIAYMAPEQLRGDPVDHRVDVFAAGIVLWEALTEQALFDGDHEGVVMSRVMNKPIEPPSSRRAGLPRVLDEVTLRALARDPRQRFQTAQEMALALEQAITPAPPREVGAWVAQLIGPELEARAARVAAIEAASLGVTGQVPAAARSSLTPASLRFGGPTPLPSFSLDEATRIAARPQPPPASTPPASTPPASAPTPGAPPGWAAPPAAAPPEPAPGPGRKGLLALVAVSLVAAVGAGMLLARGITRSTSELGEGEGRVAGSASSPPAPPAPAAESVDRPEPEPPSPALSASANAAPATTGAPSPAPSPATRRQAGAAPAHQAPRPGKADCAVPYRIDERGIRRLKPECM